MAASGLPTPLFQAIPAVAFPYVEYPVPRWIFDIRIGPSWRTMAALMAAMAGTGGSFCAGPTKKDYHQDIFLTLIIEPYLPSYMQYRGPERAIDKQ